MVLPELSMRSFVKIRTKSKTIYINLDLRLNAAARGVAKYILNGCMNVRAADKPIETLVLA